MQIPPKASLDDLEQVARPTRWSHSILGATIRRHRRTPIEQLGAEALRFLLDEGESQTLVIRIALDKLEEDPLMSGDFHRGDLLVSLLRRPASAWTGVPELRSRAFALIADAERFLPELEPADREIIARAIEGFRTMWVP